MIKKILLAFFILFIGCLIFTCWHLSNRILTTGSSLQLTKQRIKNNWGSSFEAQLEGLPDFQTVTITSLDSTKISGKYFVTSDAATCAIVMAHGWSDTWAGMLRYAPLFSDCNCNLMMIDHRGHGESERVYPTGGIKEGEDIVAVTRWLKRTDGFSNQQIGWVGVSWGAAAVIEAGALDEDVAFIIADSPFQDWYSAIFERAVVEYGDVAKVFGPMVMNLVGWRAGVDYTEASALDAASDIVEPVLLIHSEGDSETASTQSVNISNNLNQHSTFYHTEWGSDHTRDIIERYDDYRIMVHDFLDSLIHFDGCRD